jgi:hypothetical protein
MLAFGISLGDDETLVQAGGTGASSGPSIDVSAEPDDSFAARDAEAPVAPNGTVHRIKACTRCIKSGTIKKPIKRDIPEGLLARMRADAEARTPEARKKAAGKRADARRQRRAVLKAKIAAKAAGKAKPAAPPAPPPKKK